MEPINLLKSLSLSILTTAVLNQAEAFAYSTSKGNRATIDWSGIQKQIDELSRSLPDLSSEVDHILATLNSLRMAGLMSVLPINTPDRILFSDVNPCHRPYQELKLSISKFLTSLGGQP